MSDPFQLYDINQEFKMEKSDGQGGADASPSRRPKTHVLKCASGAVGEGYAVLGVDWELP